MLFDMLFQGKNDAFRRNTANKHRAINVILIELEEPECKAFYLYDGVDIDVTNFKCPKFLEMSNN